MIPYILTKFDGRTKPKPTESMNNSYFLLVRLLTENQVTQQQKITEMWANAQRDGRPAEHRWHPLFNAAKFG